MKRLMECGVLIVVMFGFLGFAQADSCKNLSPYQYKYKGECLAVCPPEAPNYDDEGNCKK